MQAVWNTVITAFAVFGIGTVAALTLWSISEHLASVRRSRTKCREALNDISEKLDAIIRKMK